MCGNDENPDMRQAVLVKLACDRYESYVVSARAIMHLYRSEEEEDNQPFENLWDILNLMYHELQVLAGMYERQISMVPNNFKVPLEEVAHSGQI